MSVGFGLGSELPVAPAVVFLASSVSGAGIAAAVAPPTTPTCSSVGLFCLECVVDVRDGESAAAADPGRDEQLEDEVRLVGVVFEAVDTAAVAVGGGGGTVAAAEGIGSTGDHSMASCVHGMKDGYESRVSYELGWPSVPACVPEPDQNCCPLH